jgi:hypothetical protein
VKKTKDELHRVWIKNHNIEASFISVKLLLVCNLMCNFTIPNYNIVHHIQIKWITIMNSCTKHHAYLSKKYTKYYTS